MTSAEDAVALKNKGNAAFKEHDWPRAIDFYTQAIEANDKEPAFYCNRAQVLPHIHPSSSPRKPRQIILVIKAYDHV
ncbi:hypothetical protein L228DRAFT_246932 [Xylona heveae TC161]|uniref:Uncharacterized protein n=1 Tax=Xylona heveae (strain CBS 132557 / TC161) TaxID=1328760 RepID=A0A165GU09_XYLHT|nr:hypothetical protein L228DRAFT_246932 [Xylona heveae TC161]KZF22597.1 hypothetical protein L228DRAFT_246932 [Xylona heveae TC161]